VYEGKREGGAFGEIVLRCHHRKDLFGKKGRGSGSAQGG